MRSASLSRRRFFALAGGAFASTAFGKSKRPPDFAKLASRLRGQLHRPGQSDWDRARILWNSRFDRVRPSAVAEVASIEDVQSVVRFARDNDLRLIARNGRHSFAGDSTADDALIVDVSRLNRVEIDGDSVRVGAGLTLFPLYQALWAQKKAVPAGRCPTVGVTGLTTVGGIGYLTRLHGPTCDSLRAATMVDADGRVVEINNHDNVDLFWALRGAGAGNFGIITSLDLEMVPADMQFTSINYEFPWSSAAKVLTAWQEWAHAAPRSVASLVEMITRAPAQSAPSITVEIVDSGPPAALEKLLADLVAAAGVAPSHIEHSTAHWFTVAGDAYCKGLRPQECQDAEITREGQFPRLSIYVKSDVAAQPWPAAGFEAIVEWLDKRQRDRVLTPDHFSATHNIGKVFIEACDGATNDVARDATAFVHRGGRFITQFQSRWHSGAPQAIADANMEWTNGLFAAVAPYRSGRSYQGYADPALEDWEHAFYGDNLPRLRQIKAKADPDNFFRFSRSIRPA